MSHLPLLRPQQWVKNLLVFAAYFYAANKSLGSLKVVAVGFTTFCLISSAVYIFNDFTDIKKDRAHPDKKHRPLASGQVKIWQAILIMFLLISLGISTLVYFDLNQAFRWIVLIYFVLNILYSLVLKNIVLVDTLVISLGFVLRAIAGGVIIGVPLSPWFLVCTFLFALYIVIGKRYQEVVNHNHLFTRSVVQDYNAELLTNMMNLTLPTSLAAYVIYTIASGHNQYMIATIVPLIYIFFRYQYLVHVKKEGESPTILVLKDWPMGLGIGIFVLLSYVVIYYL